MCNALGLNPPQGLLVRGRLHDGACYGRVTAPGERAAVDHIAVTEKDAEVERFAALCGDAQIATKIGGRRRYPWESLADAFPVGFNLCKRSYRRHDAYSRCCRPRPRRRKWEGKRS
jgi:hypothetical protein